MTNHFYIHIPFCNQKCPYCKFALTPVFDEFKKRRYIEYLKKEIREHFQGTQAVNSVGFGERNCLSQIENSTKIAKETSFSLPNSFGTFSTKSTSEIVSEKENIEINLSSSTNTGLCRDDRKYSKTIYFGGGTPSILTHAEIREILECFPFYGEIETEITLESNPEDITREYVEGLITLGINRLSMGVQTLNDQSLTEIHRSDNENILNALKGTGEALGNTGDISINIDFILGLPYTLNGETLLGIQELHKQFPFITHTSVYMLEDEDYPKHWKPISITENEMQGEYMAIMDYFQSIGWNHYELSNFAKKGYKSVHNRGYWNHSNSRGFGLSAASYEDKKRWNNSSSFNTYYKGVVENSETLTTEQIEIENMMFGLRTDGFDITDSDISPKKLQENIEKGFLEITGNRVKPTKTGIFVLDHIMGELLI